MRTYHGAYHNPLTWAAFQIKNLEHFTLSAGGNWMIYLSRIPEQIKIILLCSHFSPADYQALRGMPRVISRTWFICLRLHCKERAFQISTHTFHSSPTLIMHNVTLTVKHQSQHIHSKPSQGISLQSNLVTSNYVIPKIRNPICCLMEEIKQGRPAIILQEWICKRLRRFWISSSNPCQEKKIKSHSIFEHHTTLAGLCVYTMTSKQQG